jgi:hypothetical protein
MPKLQPHVALQLAIRAKTFLLMLAFKAVEAIALALYRHKT